MGHIPEEAAMIFLYPAEKGQKTVYLKKCRRQQRCKVFTTVLLSAPFRDKKKFLRDSLTVSSIELSALGMCLFNSQNCSLKLLPGAREIAHWLTMLIMTAVGPKFNPSPP